MDSREKTDIELEIRQARIERWIGEIGADTFLSNYLWEVQTLRYQNALQMTQQRSAVDELKDIDWV